MQGVSGSSRGGKRIDLVPLSELAGLAGYQSGLTHVLYVALWLKRYSCQKSWVQAPVVVKRSLPTDLLFLAVSFSSM